MLQTNMVVNHELVVSLDNLLSMIAQNLLTRGNFDAVRGILRFSQSFKRKHFPKTTNQCSFVLMMEKVLEKSQIDLLQEDGLSISAGEFALLNEMLAHILKDQLNFDADTMDDYDLERCKNVQSFIQVCTVLFGVLNVSEINYKSWLDLFNVYTARVYKIQSKLQEGKK